MRCVTQKLFVVLMEEDLELSREWGDQRGGLVDSVGRA